jgi:hypothetical protein
MFYKVNTGIFQTTFASFQYENLPSISFENDAFNKNS